ncbi:MAG TPA: hypothetical protein VFP84_08295 [Kofleriaceae bacterium]|nr:hypothetical protein [Kofleriaceae bacterium]
MLRAAWLRLIARVWNDNGKTNLLERLLADSQKDVRGVLPYLESTFHFVFPFPRVKLEVINANNPRWQPVGTRGWFGFADEFEVALPRKPDKTEHEAELLAEYMQMCPTMLGHGMLGIEAPDEFGAFGLTTGRVIALAWSDRAFHDQLFAADDARQLVQDAMDVVVPWNFKLKFREYEVKHLPDPIPMPASASGPIAAAVMVLDQFLSSYHFDFSHLPFTVIRLNMPDQPAGDQRAIALAAYNDTGAQYPFTCG